MQSSVLRYSRCITQPNFDSFHAGDIELIFDLYDETYFDGLLRESLNDVPLNFRLSKRMTRAGGKTSRWRRRGSTSAERYEIAISATLLFESFTPGQRSIQVTGIECDNRLDALFRIMEHEIVHLAELITWDISSCAKQRFQTIANQMFGHTDHRHSLISPGERAATEFGIKPGCHVRFDFEGQTYKGIVNRVTRRATVLVPDARGERYSDGQRYSKFYIPTSMLTVVAPSE